MESITSNQTVGLSELAYHELNTLRWNAFLDMDASVLQDVGREAAIRRTSTIEGTDEYKKYTSLVDGCSSDVEKLEAFNNG